MTQPVPDTIRELFEHLLGYANAPGQLGVASVMDKATGNDRYVLLGQQPDSDGNPILVPLGFLSSTAGDEVYPPGLEPTEFVLAPERQAEFLATLTPETTDAQV